MRCDNLTSFQPRLRSVCNRTGDPIPGPRPARLFKSIDFPWETVVDEVQEVDSASPTACLCSSRARD